MAEQDNENQDESEGNSAPGLENKLQNYLAEFEEARDVNSTALYIGTPQTNIDGPFVHEFHKFIRKTGTYGELDLILDSGGGMLDSSVKLINICNQYSENVNVFVPFYAKSAATIVALSADNIYLGRAGELGPVDPIVSHPSEDGVFVEAHSVIDAVDFIENQVTDELVKEELASQLDIYWIGFGQRAVEQSRQYLNDVGESGSDRFVEQLVEQYKDHGYPIDRTRCEELDIPIMEEDEDIEEVLYDVHETAIEFYSEENLIYIISDKDGCNIQKEDSSASLVEDLIHELSEDGNNNMPDEELDEQLEELPEALQVSKE